MFALDEPAVVGHAVTLPYSLHGINHNKIEDIKEEHLAMAVTAFDALADKALRWIAPLTPLAASADRMTTAASALENLVGR